MTIIKLFTVKEPYLVKESYGTIKKRVFTGDLFFEVTLGRQKVTLNKTNVEEFGEQPKTTQVTAKENGEKTKVGEVKKKLKKLAK